MASAFNYVFKQIVRRSRLHKHLTILSDIEDMPQRRRPTVDEI